MKALIQTLFFFLLTSQMCFAQGTWTKIGDMPEIRYAHTADEIYGKVYITGGVNTETGAYPTTMLVYEKATSTWTSIPLPGNSLRGQHTSCVVDSNLYIIGGGILLGGTVNSTDSMYMFKPSTGEWIAKNPMPTDRLTLACALLDGKIYVAGGLHCINGVPYYTGLKTFEVYDLATEAWSTLPDMPTYRWGLSMVAFGGKIYVFGGRGISLRPTAVDVYDPQDNSWTTVTNIPTPRYQLATCVLGTTIYAIDGWYSSGSGPIYDKVEVYNPLTNQWRIETPMPVAVAMLDGYALDGKIYMYGGSYTTHPNIGISDIWEFAPPEPFQLTVNVDDGWNMVSIPGLNSPDQNVNTWWAFRDPGANVFKYAGGYQPITNATPGLGYWMKHSGDRTYNTGDEWPSGGIQVVPHDPISASAGWNLFGGYELSVTTSGLTTNPAGLIEGSVYKYSGGYQVATTLDPGYGYWVKLTGAGQIIITETLSKSEPIEFFPEDWGRIVLTDAAGVSYTLYAVHGEVNLDQYELPPAPPPGMFDIRYSSGRIAENLSSDLQIIEMQGIAYPITIKAEGLTIALQDENGEIVNSVLAPGKELIINNSSVNKLVILSAELGKSTPAVFSLEQNYPNPFNPSTVFSYQLPINGNVTLKVFDILGNEINTLVNEYKTAGRYEVEFSASTLPSGVYFYQLKAVDPSTGSGQAFVETKKMILLR